MKLTYIISVAVCAIFSTATCADMREEVGDVQVQEFSVENVSLEKAIELWQSHLTNDFNLIILYENEEIRNRRVTLTLRNINAYWVLRFITQSVNCQHTFDGSNLLIKNKQPAATLSELASCPKSIAEAIEMLDEKLHATVKTKLKDMEEGDLASLHMSLGLGIRNSFCLWNRTELTDEMNRTFLVSHADEMSTILIDIYCEHLTEPEFNLDKLLQQRRAEAIKTLNQDLQIIRQEIDKVDKEHEGLRAAEKDILELLGNKSEPNGAGQPM